MLTQSGTSLAEASTVASLSPVPSRSVIWNSIVDPSRPLTAS